MRTKDYNLELIRMASFVLVIAIHVSNYFCRAYGQISDGEYLFSLVIDTFARGERALLLYDLGRPASRTGRTAFQTLETAPALLPGPGSLERDLLSLEHLLYEIRF